MKTRLIKIYKAMKSLEFVPLTQTKGSEKEEKIGNFNIRFRIFKLNWCGGGGGSRGRFNKKCFSQHC
jgi:hypothetical protein